MDELDDKKVEKSYLKSFDIIIICFFILFAIPLVISYIRSREVNEEVILAFIILFGIYALIRIIKIEYLLLWKYFYNDKKVINYSKVISRDINISCSPAIASVIYDSNIEIYKDCTAVILNLVAKKYISIKKENNIYKYFIEASNEDILKLDNHEIYIIECLCKLRRFDSEEFLNYTYEDAFNRGLILNEKINKRPKLIVVNLIHIALILISTLITRYLVYFCLFLLVFSNLVMMSFYENEKYDDGKRQYKRTEEGIELAIQLNNLKKFLKDYTLIQEKPIDYVKILDEYIAYAIAIDEGDVIEEYIKQNEEYRDLIYNREPLNF